MGPVEHDLAQQLCQNRGLPRGHEPWHDHVPGQRLDGIVIDAGEHILQAAGGPFDHDVPVAGFGQPLSRAMGDFDGSDLRRHRLGVEEVRGYEGRQARAECVLLARNDRGVRDRQAQGMAEERGDGEPVGDRADHGRLGGSGDEAPDTGVVGEDVGGQEDERGEDEQGQRERAHLLQPASTLLILRPEFAGPTGSASAETRHGCCFVDRHRYPLATDSSEIRAFDLHPRAGSRLGIQRDPIEGPRAGIPHRCCHIRASVAYPRALRLAPWSTGWVCECL